MRWLLALAMLLGLVAPAAARPELEHVGTAGRITVYAESGLGDVANELATQGEDALRDIGADLYGLTTPTHVELRVVRDAADLPSVAPAGRGAPPWAVGVAYPDLGVITIALRRSGDITDPRFTLRHELAHLALGAALGPRAPHWLHEGFAYQHSPEYSNERIETLAGMAWLGNVIPLNELDAAFPDGEIPAHRAYAESYDFVRYLANRGRWEDTEDDGNRYPFRRFLYELAQGASVDTAAIKSFGRPIGPLFEEWKSDLAKRYRLVPLGLVGLALWIAVALLLVLAYLRRRRQNKRRVAQWEADEAARKAREGIAQVVVVPPYVPWPGDDPLGEPDEDPPPGPRLMN